MQWNQHNSLLKSQILESIFHSVFLMDSDSLSIEGIALEIGDPEARQVGGGGAIVNKNIIISILGGFGQIQPYFYFSLLFYLFWLTCINQIPSFSSCSPSHFIEPRGRRWSQLYPPWQWLGWRWVLPPRRYGSSAAGPDQFEFLRWGSKASCAFWGGQFIQTWYSGWGRGVKMKWPILGQTENWSLHIHISYASVEFLDKLQQPQLKTSVF